jgi:hypothetical protein
VPPPVLNKTDMYRRLAAGEFGNTLQSWNDLDKWKAEAPVGRWPLWGVRSEASRADPRFRLNVPAAEVGAYCRGHFPNGGYNLTPMIVDCCVSLRAVVHECDYGHPFGTRVDFVVGERGTPWREAFKKYGTHSHGVIARNLLELHLWPNDLANLRRLLRDYPKHAVELSACDRAVGVVPNRNSVCWEVRLY